MKTTQLHAYHEEHAKMTEFAGYEMPLWYTTTAEEHMAVRNDCGIFDVSHMGRLVVEGRDAAELLEILVPTKVGTQPVGKAFYTLLLNECAGIIDDLIINHESEERFFLVVNAANTLTDFDHIRRHASGRDVTISDITESSALVAVQGPRAQAVLQALTSLDLGQLKRFRTAEATVLNRRALISRTGYTGEDGFEVTIYDATNENPEGALDIWNRLAETATPCGLGARDSLRLEAGYPLHGSDIDQETNPVQADLTWVVAADKGGYVGAEALAEVRQTGPDVIRRGLVLEHGIPRHGFSVLDSGSNPIGTVTSGTFSPTLRRGIALCKIKVRNSELGSKVGVSIRDTEEGGRLVKPPFYDETIYGWKRAGQR